MDQNYYFDKEFVINPHTEKVVFSLEATKWSHFDTSKPFFRQEDPQICISPLLWGYPLPFSLIFIGNQPTSMEFRFANNQRTKSIHQNPIQLSQSPQYFASSFLIFCFVIIWVQHCSYSPSSFKGSHQIPNTTLPFYLKYDALTAIICSIKQPHDHTPALRISVWLPDMLQQITKMVQLNLMPIHTPTPDQPQKHAKSACILGLSSVPLASLIFLQLQHVQ